MVDITKNMFKSIVSDSVYNKSFPKLIGTDKQTILKKYNLTEKYLIISPSNSHQKRNILNYRAWENESWKELIEKLSYEDYLKKYKDKLASKIEGKPWIIKNKKSSNQENPLNFPQSP